MRPHPDDHADGHPGADAGADGNAEDGREGLRRHEDGSSPVPTGEAQAAANREADPPT